MSGRPAATAPRRYDFPRFVRSRLDNGLGVWIMPLPERELVSVHLAIDAGAAAEDEAQAGVAALTAHLLTTGTADLDAAAFAEAAERAGIDVSSGSSWDNVHAGFTALGDKFSDGLALLADVVRRPRLDAGEFDRLRAERLNEILQARSDPGHLADERFIGEVYADGVPYGRMSAGSPESVESLTIEDVRGFHGGRYAPDVAHVIVAGPVDPAAALASVRDQFGDWAGTGPGHRSVEPVARGGRRVVVVDRPGSVQSELRVGHVGIGRGHPDYFAAMVTAAVLGGVFGSRLNRRLREELGYTYGARCSFDPRRSAGPFTATTAVATDVTADAIGELLAQLERIRSDPPGEEELREVRDFLIGVFPLRFESIGGLAGALEPVAVYGLADDYWQTYRARLEAVTPADVARVAETLIRPDEALILLTGEASAIRAGLESANLGSVEVVPAG